MKKHIVFTMLIWSGLLMPQIGFASENDIPPTEPSLEESSSSSWWDTADKVGGGLILGALLLGAWQYLSQRKSSAGINIRDAAENFYNAFQLHQPIDDSTLKFSLDAIERNISRLIESNEQENLRVGASIRAYAQNLSNNAKSGHSMQPVDYSQKILEKLETTTPAQL